MSMNRIFLLGMPGSGKSHIGKRLAERLGWSFWDNDAAVEAHCQCSIPTLFQQKGEAYFRTLERQVLEQVAQKERVVVSLGGGTPCFWDTMTWIKQQGTSFFLNPPLAVLLERLQLEPQQRPLFQGKSPEELEQAVGQLYQQRLFYYQQATHTLEEPSVEAIVKMIF